MEHEHKFAEYDFSDHADSSKGSETWMMTFADILALMLVFFIMNYAMSTVKKGEWETVTSAIANSFKSSSFIESLTDGAPLSADNQTVEVATDIGYLYTVLRNKIDENSFLAKNVDVKKLDDRIELSFSSSMMFEYSDNKFSYDGELAIFSIGNIINKISNKIEIKVYADDMPVISPDKFSSNLELSFMRGILIGEEIQKFGNSSKIDVFINSFEPFNKRDTDQSGRFGKASIIIREHIGEKIGNN